MDRKKELLWRSYLVMMFFVIATLVIMFKIFKITVLEGDKWREKAGDNIKWRVVDADRGNIYSDEMDPLALSLQFFEVRMDLSVIKEETFNKYADSLALYLSNFPKEWIRPKTKEAWKKDLIANRNNRYYFIARGLDVDAYKKLKNDAPILKLGRYAGGMITLRYGKRVKPYRDLASRTIGVDRENADKVGLEGYFDRFLKGVSDQRLMKRLASKEDVWVPVYDPSENEIKRGSDIVTTLNVDIQDFAHKALQQSLLQYEADGGTVVVMEVATGAIKAMVNLSRASDGTYTELYNHAIARVSEPGSTMKLATVLALMEDGYATMDSKVNLNFGQRRFSDRTMHDSEPHGKTMVSMAEAFELSSNVGIAALANDAYNSLDGRKKWYSRLESFGFTDATGIDILGEAVPEVKNPQVKEKWYGTTVPWMAHGYELQQTPLHMLSFYNAVANGGKLMKPYLVSKIITGEKVKTFAPVVMKSAIASPQNILSARQMLEGVVLRGTGKANVKSDVVEIAGKTGTTRVNYARQEEVPQYNASFAGYFPADNPKYSAIVVVYGPKHHFYGGMVAGPVFRQIAEKIHLLKNQQIKVLTDSSFVVNYSLPDRTAGYSDDFKKVFDYVGLPYEEKSRADWARVEPFENTMLLGKNKMNKKYVPDCRGMGARDASYILESLGMKVNIVGIGKVESQSIPPGAIAERKSITVYLN
jgi:cell division protein FtsI (penicillin-binding protein 3)